MNHAELSSAIALYAEDFETGFTQSIDGFIRAAEQKIYNLADVPATNQTLTTSLTANVRSLDLGASIVAVNDVELFVGGVSRFLLSKEPSFLREAYPDSSVFGVPSFYAVQNATTLVVAPAPDSAYPVEVHYFGYPASIVDSGTSWLGDNFDQALLYGALVEAGTYQKQSQEQMAVYMAGFRSAMEAITSKVGARNSADFYRSGRR